MDNILLKKAQSIERCIMRIKEDYEKAEKSLTKNITIQDAIILNLQRACQAAISGSNRLIKTKKLGLSSSAGDSFKELLDSGLIKESLYHKMTSMVGFRNLSIHEYEKLDLEILKSIIENHLDDLSEFASILIDQA